MIMKTMYIAIAVGVLLVIALVVFFLKGKKEDDGLKLYTEEEKAKLSKKDTENQTTTPNRELREEKSEENVEEKPKEVQYVLDDTSRSILSLFSVNDKILQYLSDSTLSGGANTHYKDRAIKMGIYKNITEKYERVKVNYHDGSTMLDVELTPDYSKGIYRKYDKNGNQLAGGPFSSVSVLRQANLLSTFKKAPLYIFILYGLLDDNMVEELEENN